MAKRVIISAPGRLHFNSLKMNSFGGRGCGGIGLSLTRPRMTLIFDRAPEIIIVGANKQLRKKIENFAREVLKCIKSELGVRIEVVEFFPGQIGLGSGTQLGLSVGQGIGLLYGKKFKIDDIAKLTKRSGVSGIGYYAFSKGGLIVDGGYRMGEHEAKKSFADHSPTPPPLVGRYRFPDNWKILLISPQGTPKKNSDIDEGELFLKNTPIPLDEVGSICSYVLMGMIPALQERDYFAFMAGLSRIGHIGTKKIELELNKKNLEDINTRLDGLLVNKLIRNGENEFYWHDLSGFDIKENFSPDKIPCLLLSSLGPSLFSILLSEYHNFEKILSELASKLPKGWKADIVSANNNPVKIEIID